MRQVIVIPARMKGTRLPGKPLIDILGKPMVRHVWERCTRVQPTEDIYVATEDEVIEKYCERNDIKCINTGPADTAIDRLKLFSDIIKADSYINVQGDEPVINPRDIKTILDYNIEWPDRVVFGKAKATEDEFKDYSKAKVVCDLNGRLLYSSRAGIPLNNKGMFVSAERAIWIYSFTRESLNQYYNNREKTFYDKIEDNEIIRFLEIGIPVYCVDVLGNSWAVDEQKDLAIVESIIKNENNKY